MFYFRDVSVLESLDKEQRYIYAESGFNEQLLYQLKQRIIDQGFKIQWFSSADEMSDMIEIDFINQLNIDYSDINNLNISEEEKEFNDDLFNHQTYGNFRKVVYIGGDIYMKELDLLINNFKLSSKKATTIGLIIGQSGYGTSSLLANWTSRVRQRYPEQDELFIIVRYIGSSKSSTHITGLLKSIMYEITKKIKGWNLSLPENNSEIISLFSSWIQIASSFIPILLVLDGLHQLDHQNHVNNIMKWIPKLNNNRLTFICSIRDKTSLYYKHIKKQATLYQCIAKDIILNKFTDLEVKECTTQWLGMYGKVLDNKQMQKILDCNHTRNPLYLVTFLNELRGFGIYELINTVMDDYLQAINVIDMFKKVIKGLENDYNSVVDGMVKYVLSLLLIAKKGLHETELKEALIIAMTINFNEHKFPVLEFSSFMLKMNHLILNTRGLLKFTLTYFEEAIKECYFGGEKEPSENSEEGLEESFDDLEPPKKLVQFDVIDDDKGSNEKTYQMNNKDNNLTYINKNLMSYHWILAQLFQSNQIISNQRKADELPYHLYQCICYYHTIANDQKVKALELNLIQTLTNPKLILILCQSIYLSDLHFYWHNLELNQKTKTSLV